MAQSPHFSIINHNSSSSDPLLTHNPHELIPLLELESFGEDPKNNIQDIPSPRILSTHLNLLNLPDSVLSSGCRVLYIARNPMDTLVSYWHFFNKPLGFSVLWTWFMRSSAVGLVVASRIRKEKEKESLLFLTYEELKEDPEKHVKRLAEFLGCSLASSEIKEIVKKSSYQRLRNLDVNQNGSEKVHWSGIGFGSFFRQGVVGDWKNHLSPEMVQRLDQIASQKFEGSGLELESIVRSS
ncbi:cytosolic sulfotransferase 12-like [Vitis vinifera]|uniref:cytosolic sulfotransferase 12-like n=1 Tax=Vitis vinifera TaxID=29760 RepID=UPI0008FEC68B|nr:cytosolic sulfotransferase 12-like [Vitis vinifera]|eukprot:XP_019079578.1 PREDICTED: cytosolic sulfotransferase 12-like [Vitis vinifera]